uniref:Uncharacterized protein n=1 Tax=Pseudomonas aeruginosa TaxID=287 RepID=A0A6H1QB47_PSEAI|nr:hypothetical protein [Pseudomonas aeruginosa]
MNELNERLSSGQKVFGVNSAGLYRNVILNGLSFFQQLLEP